MTPEEETLEKIKFVLLCKNDPQAIRIIEQYGYYKKEQALQLLQTDVSGSDVRLKKTLICKDGTIWHLTNKEVEQWEKDGSIKAGDKLYRTIAQTLY